MEPDRTAGTPEEGTISDSPHAVSCTQGFRRCLAAGNGSAPGRRREATLSRWGLQLRLCFEESKWTKHAAVLWSLWICKTNKQQSDHFFANNLKTQLYFHQLILVSANIPFGRDGHHEEYAGTITEGPTECVQLAQHCPHRPLVGPLLEEGGDGFEGEHEQVCQTSVEDEDVRVRLQTSKNEDTTQCYIIGEYIIMGRFNDQLWG